MLEYSVKFHEVEQPRPDHLRSNEAKNLVYSVNIKKQTKDAIAMLPNGHYNISLSASGSSPFQASTSTAPT